MSKKLDLSLSSVDDLFSTEKQRQEQKLERVQEIHPPNPFHLVSGFEGFGHALRFGHGY